VNVERRREREIERIRALNGACLTGKERLMYETLFAVGDKLEVLADRMRIASYKAWFDEQHAQMAHLNEAVGAAIMNAFARREASRQPFEMRRAALWTE